MPFGNIVAQTVTFEPRTPGLYSKSGLQFTDPANEFRVRGGTPGKGGSTSSSVTRVLQKDVTVGSSVVRKSAALSLQIQAPTDGGFTSAELDSMATDIAEFLTATTISRLMQGEA